MERELLGIFLQHRKPGGNLGNLGKPGETWGNLGTNLGTDGNLETLETFEPGDRR